MSMLNVWRIPILFMVSGMGVRFAMERRDWKQLLADRTLRILLPLVFGSLTLSPFFIYVGMNHFGDQTSYIPHFGHLWFLANIYAYVLVLLPVMFYLKNRPDCLVWRLLLALIRIPGAILVAALPVMVEAWLFASRDFSSYVTNLHGFALGLICFVLGFVFVSLQAEFWPAVRRVRWISLALAATLYLVRLLVFRLQGMPDYLIGLESMCWMLAVIGFASVHLNHPSRALSYFSKAVYPVYIVHLPVQFVLAYYIVPLSLSATNKLIMMVVGTFFVSWVLYEFIIRRLKWIRPLFGMKLNQR
jgi:hypothetical protein